MSETLKAGRELDAEIAEKVMGLTVAHPLNGVGETLVQWRSPTTGHLMLVKAQPYSTDIAAAWQVVEKMRELGWALELRNIHKWDAVFGQRNTSRSRVHAEDCETAPLSICLAALKAVSGARTPERKTGDAT